MADAAKASGPLHDALAAWPVPGTADAADRESLDAAWREAEAEQSPAWRATLIQDFLTQRRLSPVGLEVLASYGVHFDPRANAEAICGHLAELARVSATDGLSLLAAVVEVMPEPPDRRHLLVSGVMHERTNLRGDVIAPHRPLVRVPALFDATLTAVEVDGEPFATPMPNGIPKRQTFRRSREPTQGDLWPAPRTLAGNPADPVLQMVAGLKLTGDERNTLRSDVIAISRIVYALTGSVRIPAHLGAALLGGKDTVANRQRWNDALLALRWGIVTVNERTHAWRDLAVVSIGADDDAVIGPPAWWTDGEGERRYRLTAGLLRPALIRKKTRGPGEGYWSGLARTVDGIEALLSYGPSAGKGRGGRIPDLLRPEDGRKAGPGPEAFIPWRNVLRAAGEHVEPDADPKDSAGRRYRRRIEALASARYMAAGRKAAQAGDSVEVVRSVKGGKGRESGLIVRASARFTEAIKRGERTRIPASSAFPGAFTGEAGDGEVPGE